MKLKYALLLGVFASLLLVQAGSKAGYWSEWWLIVPPVLGLIILTWGVTQIHSQFFVKAECSFLPEGNEIILSFDDGPHPEKTPEILALLKKYDAKALFFCIGKEVDKYPQIAKQIVEDGHELGSHSYSHGYGFDFLSAAEVKRSWNLRQKPSKEPAGRQPDISGLHMALPTQTLPKPWNHSHTVPLVGISAHWTPSSINPKPLKSGY